MAAFVETLDGKFLNLDRVSLVQVLPDRDEPGWWMVLATAGNRTHALGSYPSSADAREHAMRLVTR